MAPRRILIIDDEPVFGAMLGEALQHEGFETDISHDGLHGIARFHEIRPDVVVTDVILPGREGLEVLQAVKAAAPEVKVVAISGGGRVVGSGSILELARQLGADATLAKPFAIADLVQALQAFRAA